MRTGEFMTDKVIFVHPDTPVAGAAHLMPDTHISGLPVTDALGHVVKLPRPEGRGFGVSRTALPIPRRSDS
jgi:CBS domain-containing protein